MTRPFTGNSNTKRTWFFSLDSTLNQCYLSTGHTFLTLFIMARLQFRDPLKSCRNRIYVFLLPYPSFFLGFSRTLFLFQFPKSKNWNSALELCSLWSSPVTSPYSCSSQQLLCDNYIVRFPDHYLLVACVCLFAHQIGHYQEPVMYKTISPASRGVHIWMEPIPCPQRTYNLEELTESGLDSLLILICEGLPYILDLKSFLKKIHIS